MVEGISVYFGWWKIIFRNICFVIKNVTSLVDLVWYLWLLYGITVYIFIKW